MDMCMHGSQRRKRTGRLTNRPDIFKKLEAICDGGHLHQKWGPIQDPVTNKWTFATGQECEFPLTTDNKLNVSSLSTILTTGECNCHSLQSAATKNSAVTNEAIQGAQRRTRAQCIQRSAGQFWLQMSPHVCEPIKKIKRCCNKRIRILHQK